MALGGAAVIEDEDIKEGDGTLRRAMELWNARKGPVTYNVWQSAFFAMRRNERIVDTDAVPGEAPSDRQKRMRTMFIEVQEAPWT